MLFLLALTSRSQSISLQKASLSYSTFPQSIRLQIALLSFSFDKPSFFLTPTLESTDRKKSVLSLSVLKMHCIWDFQTRYSKMPCIMSLYKCKLSLCWHYLFHFMVHFYRSLSSHPLVIGSLIISFTRFSNLLSTAPPPPPNTFYGAYFPSSKENATLDFIHEYSAFPKRKRKLPLFKHLVTWSGANSI